MDEQFEPICELDIGHMVDQAHGDGKRQMISERSADPVKHFGFAAMPFADNVNPEFFFRTESHEEAFIAMKRCIEEHVSLGLTTAISGTGKTLLTQVLIQELDPRRYQPVLILAYPGMTRTALLKELASELKLEDLSRRPTTHALISAIQGHIIQQYIKGMRLILIIDEVHFLGADTLHILRTLSNIEVPEQKLVSVLLFGERSFLAKMKRPTFASVFSRTFARVEIRPLNRQETQQYVKFRLLMAGGRPQLFNDKLFPILHEMTGGIPREINRLCHNALAFAARMDRPSVTPDILNLLKESGRI
jgi:general secretion pathway protein A